MRKRFPYAVYWLRTLVARLKAGATSGSFKACI